MDYSDGRGKSGKIGDEICQDRRNIGGIDLATGEKANDAEMTVCAGGSVKQLLMERTPCQQARGQQQHPQQTSQS